MSTPLLGSIMLFAGNFAPAGYQQCAGQLLPIDQYTAVFSILGTTYGGNGTTNFALPDLRGRAPIGAGQGTGLSNYVEGENGGTESVTILTNNLPAHSHTLPASTNQQTTNRPGGSAVPSEGGIYDTTSNATMAPTGLTGSNVPISIQSPYLAIFYCIALEGVFPSRN